MESLKVSDTPAAEWRVSGEEDPHKGKYECKRSELTLGNLTDDQLANEVFMYGDNKPTMQELMAGTAKMPVVYLTAGKERIRWLSRLSESQKKDKDRLAEENAELREMLKNYVELVENDSSEDFLYRFNDIKQLLAKHK